MSKKAEAIINCIIVLEGYRDGVDEIREDVIKELMRLLRGNYCEYIDELSGLVGYKTFTTRISNWGSKQ